MGTGVLWENPDPKLGDESAGGVLYEDLSWILGTRVYPRATVHACNPGMSQEEPWGPLASQFPKPGKLHVQSETVSQKIRPRTAGGDTRC